jgi:predicted membrane protein
MPSVIELVGPVPTPDWGAWEPLALTLLTSGAAALILACLAGLFSRRQRAARPLALAALAAGLAGQAALLISLEQPLRAFELFTRPHFTSWTAVGAFAVPLFLLCAALAAYRARAPRSLGRGFSALALWPAAVVFVYATNEIMACTGRGLWTGPLTPAVFLAAGLSGAVGLACSMAARTDAQNDIQIGAAHGAGSLAASLAGLSAFGAFLCAALAFALPKPDGFAAATSLWWHAPEVLCLCCAGLAAAGWRRPAHLAPAAGAASLLASFLLYWKLITMGQAFARTASTVADKAAFLDLVSWPTLLATAGAAGLLLALAAVLPALLPERPAA